MDNLSISNIASVNNHEMNQQSTISHDLNDSYFYFNIEAKEHYLKEILMFQNSIEEIESLILTTFIRDFKTPTKTSNAKNPGVDPLKKNISSDIVREHIQKNELLVAP